MNMITFTSRSREAICDLHSRIADALEAQNPANVEAALRELEGYTLSLAREVIHARDRDRNLQKISD